MKTLKLLLIMVSITMLSCQNSDCSNGIQDGNETGIDCGGDCVACQPQSIASSTEQQLAGTWYFDKKILGYEYAGDTIYDTTYYTGIACQCQLTLDPAEPSDQYWAYGSFGECTYGSAVGWWVNDNTGLLNDIYTIDLLTSDSLITTSTTGWGTWYYYR